MEMESKSKQWEWSWGKEMYKRLLGTKPIEAEGEIIIDHNYDGIKELDNKLACFGRSNFGKTCSLENDYRG